MAIMPPSKSISSEAVERIETLLGLTHTEPTLGIIENGVTIIDQGSANAIVRVEYVARVSAAFAIEITRLLNGGEVR